MRFPLVLFLALSLLCLGCYGEKRTSIPIATLSAQTQPVVEVASEDNATCTRSPEVQDPRTDSRVTQAAVAPNARATLAHERTARERPPREPSAIELALNWLRDHQNEDGSWSELTYQTAPGSTTRTGVYASLDGTPDTARLLSQDRRVGLTGMALLAFLGCGHTHRQGEYQRPVRNAVRYLVTRCQRQDGSFTNDVPCDIYDHCLATYALCESYGMTGAANLREPAQRAVNYLLTQQRRTMDDRRLGWGWENEGGNTLATGLAVLALRDARVCDLEVPTDVFAAPMAFLESLATETSDGVRVGLTVPYHEQFPDSRDAVRLGTTDAIYLQSCLYAGESRSNESLIRLARRLTRNDALPGTIVGDPWHWFFTVNAVRYMSWRHLGEFIDSLIAAMDASIRRECDPTDAVYGSADPVSSFLPYTGRVGHTALTALNSTLTYIGYEFIGSTREPYDDD